MIAIQKLVAVAGETWKYPDTFSLPLEIDWRRNLDQFLLFFHNQFFFTLMHITMLRYNQRNQIFTFIKPFRSNVMANAKQVTEVQVVLDYRTENLV